MKFEEKIKELIKKCDDNMDSIDTQIELLDKEITDARKMKLNVKTLKEKVCWEEKIKIVVEERSNIRRNYYALQDDFQIETLQEIKTLLN